MALGFFALALFLFLGLDSEDGYASYATASSSSEGVEVRSVFLIPFNLYMKNARIVLFGYWESVGKELNYKASVWLARKENDKGN